MKEKRLRSTLHRKKRGGAKTRQGSPKTMTQKSKNNWEEILLLFTSLGIAGLGISFLKYQSFISNNENNKDSLQKNFEDWIKYIKSNLVSEYPHPILDKLNYIKTVLFYPENVP
jgi:hypothetical protein